MFKQYHKHSLIFGLLLLTQMFVVTVSKAQDTDRNPVPVPINEEYSLLPATAARMDTPPSPPGNHLDGTTAATTAEPSVVIGDVVDINTRRDAGSQLIAGLQTSAISELTIDETRLFPAEMTTLTLGQDPTPGDPFDNLNDGTTFFMTVFVPSEAVRFVAEVAETTALDVQIFVGQGLVPSAESLVCDGGAADYCNVQSPDKGDWWVLVQNRSETAVSPDTVTLAHAAVTQDAPWCSHLQDCLEDFLACLGDGSFDECWQALLDCLLEGMDPAAQAELEACLLNGGGADCFEAWEDCFPGWFDSNAALLDAALNDDHGDDDDCDDGDGAHQYDNYHDDDHFTHHERCHWQDPLPQNMWVEGPAVVAEMEPFDLRVFWDEPAITAGDIWYGAFDIGSNPSHPGDIGTIYVDLNRFDDDVVKKASVATAVSGDILTYTIAIQPNVTPEDPTYTITDTIPAGMTYVPGSASATGGTVNVTGDVLTWTGPTSVPGFTYHVDTSVTNPACAAPAAGADGVADGYLDLAAFGYAPDPIIFGDSVWYQAPFTGGEFYLFGSPQGNLLNFTDDGFAFLSGSGPGATPQIHQPIPDVNDPNNLLAAMWRDMEIVYDGTRGVTVVALVDANLAREVAGIIEFDGMQDRTIPGSTATYGFEVVAYFDVDPSRYEYIFAYNNLSDSVTTGTIGLENAAGTQGVQFGYNDLVLTDGMAICFDQVGNGGTAVEISYQVQVNENAFGIITNEAIHNTDNPGSKEAVASVDVSVKGKKLYLSDSSGGLAGGVAYADEDIVRYDLDSGDWSLYLDGSDVGLKGTDIDALHMLDDGSVLLSLAYRLKIPGFGKVDDSDIIRFVPTAVGEDSAGSFEMYFDGSDYGLNRSSEDVDTIGFAGDGRLVISTRGSFKVPQANSSSMWCWDGLDAAASHFGHCDRLWGRGEDFIVLDQDGSGWDMYFDGSDVLDHRVDWGDTWINPITGDIYLSSRDDFTLDTLDVSTQDIFVCRPQSLGSDTQCAFSDELFFDGNNNGFEGTRINGFAIAN